MMKRKNCWEVMKCGREPNGEKVEELGVCPASLSNKYDGVNGGKFGGRFCWAVAGTFYEGEVQGTYARKLVRCLRCEFLKQVHEEEGRFFKLVPEGVIRE
ncbi:MAG: two-CW domain-containing protein [Candidatus Scalinduaceae bacterium]